ncbi:MAG TPA: hypothetical protein HPQ00_10685 [Magnetococcales bacterium]|nr:hypothetical protein [Magnetococcales bacterium]
MLRILLLGILLYVGYRLVSYFFFNSTQKKSQVGTETGGGDDVLVSCSSCNTRVPRQLMVQRPNGLYCSVSCADS